MELILAILAAGPIGFFVQSYEHGLAAYLAAWAIILPVQTVVVYSEDDGGWLYWLFNALILAAGVGLNRLGSALGWRRRTPKLAAVDPVRSCPRVSEDEAFCRRHAAHIHIPEEVT